MTKPLTYRKPSGEWGIEGVDLSALPRQWTAGNCGTTYWSRWPKAF